MANSEYKKLDYTEIPKQYICAYCNQIYENVAQADCGCRYCFHCLDELLNGTAICKMCNTKLAKDYKMLDKAFQRELNCFVVDCNQCEWKGKLSEYRAHYDHEHPHIICEYCNDTFKNANSLNDHLNNDKCPLKPENCLFHECNCNEMITNSNKEEHLNSNIHKHLSLMFNYFNKRLLRIEEKTTHQISDASSNDKNTNSIKEELDQLKKSLSNTQSSIVGMVQRFITQEKASYNGVLTWKITNVQEKIIEARNGRQSCIYSQPFYTSQCGYKMCAKMYLNGDGMGSGTHLSLFFIIMKGEYDALLKWPFRQKVTFMLIDQSPTKKENIIDAFRPDPNSNSFKRPTSDMNVASGIPLFCSLTKVLSNDHEYIQDDTLFLKIVVDIRDLTDV